MTRRPRRDKPGAFHHVIARGIARTDIVADDADRERFLGVAARVFDESQTRAFAWALMDNHVHWLVESGARSISNVFQRVHGSYAMSYNRRHDRVGHVFQDRFVSFRVDSEEYLVALLLYINLNPVRAGIVSIDDLPLYPWTSYPALLGDVPRPFHDRDRALALFGESRDEATRCLDAMMRGALDRDGPMGPHPLPGWLPVDARGRAEAGVLGEYGRFCRSDELDRVTRELESRSIRRAALRRAGWDVDRVIDGVARHLRVSPVDLRAGSHRAACCRARAIVAYLACTHLGLSHAHAAEATGVARSAVTHSLRRAEAYARGAGIDPATFLVL